MNISKENLFVLLDTFGDCIWLYPAPNTYFPDTIDKKINLDPDRLTYIKNNLDKPFNLNNGKQKFGTLYDFIVNQVWTIDITDNEDLGISKTIRNIKLPKKEIDTSWLWNKINKALDNQSMVLTKLCNTLKDKLNLNNTVYATSFGLSIKNLYNSNAENTVQQITNFCVENSIKYKELYSKGHWVINIIISKEQRNINQLKQSLNINESNKRSLSNCVAKLEIN